jgi:hypothetical protein
MNKKNKMMIGLAVLALTTASVWASETFRWKELGSGWGSKGACFYAQNETEYCEWYAIQVDTWGYSAWYNLATNFNDYVDAYISYSSSPYEPYDT